MVINKIQKIEKNGIVTQITDPNGHIVLMIVSPDQFSMLENDKTSIHYCTIIGDVVHISSKAKYRTVKIHYATDPVC